MSPAGGVGEGHRTRADWGSPEPARPPSPAPHAAATAANKALGSWQGPCLASGLQMLPPSHSGASAPGPRDRMALPCRHGAPPQPHTSGVLPSVPPQGGLDGSAPHTSHAEPQALRQAPEQLSPQAQSATYSASGTLPWTQVEEFINLLSRGLQLLLCRGL